MKEIHKDLVCTITDNNINIENSYKIETRSEMSELLYAIKHNHPECNVFKRKWNDLISEWRTHNRLYKIGFKKERTQDTDLNYPMPWYYQILYNIIGI